MRVYTSKLTPDSVVTYLFHDWTQLVIVLPSVARACDDQSTVHLDWQLRDYQYSRVRNVWWINRVLLRILIWFSYQFAGFHVANRAVTLLLLLRRCMTSFSAFFIANAVAHVHRQRVYFHDAPRNAGCAQSWLLQRLLGVFAARSALQCYPKVE